MRRRPLKLSWQVKLPLMLVAFAIAPLAMMAFWTLDLVETSHEASTLQGLEALARAKSESITQFTEDRKSEVERIAQLTAEQVADLEEARAEEAAKVAQASPPAPLPELEDAEQLPPPTEQTQDAKATDKAQKAVLRDTVAAAVERPAALDKLHRELRRQLALILWDQQKFEELLVIAANGDVLVSTFSEHEGTTATGLDYFQNGLGATFVQSVFMSPITERLTMVISAPIRDRSAEVIGVLAARLNLDRFFRMINDSAGLGETGETLVGKLIESSVLFMAPTRHDPHAALTRRVSLGSSEGAVLQNGARGERGVGRVVDYRGRCTYAAWEHVPSLDWALGVKIDCEEANATVIALRDRLLALTLTIVALALSAAFLVSRALVHPLGELKDATERISKGDFDVQLRIQTGDEIGALAESFERMVAAIKFFRANAGRREDDLTPFELEEQRRAQSDEDADIREPTLPPGSGNEPPG